MAQLRLVAPQYRWWVSESVLLLSCTGLAERRIEDAASVAKSDLSQSIDVGTSTPTVLKRNTGIRSARPHSLNASLRRQSHPLGTIASTRLDCAPYGEVAHG